MSTSLVDRRTLLKGALAAGAAMAVAGAVHLPGAAVGRRFLSEHEGEVVAAIAEAYFPGGFMPLDGVEAGVVDRIDDMLAHWFPTGTRVAFRYMLRAIEWGSLAAYGGRFSTLAVEDRRAILDAWAAPGFVPRRLASDALKMAFGIAYFSHPDVTEHIGWRSTCSSGGLT